MTVARGPADRAQCWCCGGQFAEPELVRLGARPEAAVCPRCARSLNRQAAARADQAHPTWGGRLRTQLRRTRHAVITRGWHRRAFIGRLLRAIDRRLP